MKLGATGKFPQGKLNARDEGELTIAVGIKDGVVMIDFGKPVKWRRKVSTCAGSAGF